MILGLSRMPVAACFEELDVALQAVTARTVCLNAHAFPDDVPAGAAVMNTENVPGQVPDPRALWPHRELWDISARHAARYGARHVPVGYHASMQRFERVPSEAQDIDVVFAGCMNERRSEVFQELADRGLVVVAIPPGIYGAQRDGYLARAKVAVNMLFYPDGIYPVLRAAHLVANRVPMVSEQAAEPYPFAEPVPYERLVDEVARLATASAAERYDRAERYYEAFRAMPLEVPS